MVFGDPNRFAVIVKVIDEWNEKRELRSRLKFYNGILIFCVDGFLFPQVEVAVSSLCVDVPWFIRLIECVPNADKYDLFELDKVDTFCFLLNNSFSDTKENDDVRYFLVSPPTLSDKQNMIFFIKKDNMFRIIASHVEYDLERSDYYLGSNIIRETYISVNEIEPIIEGLKGFIEIGFDL
ncbi:MAG: hypothetical protein IJR58_08870 [Lachnospiraceae bacterium]|nr:hypothetical protein [Lachnospiraceae bacterium]